MKRRIAITLGLVAAIVLGIGTYSLLHRPANPLAIYAQSVDFPLYYPSSLPDGYSISQDTSYSDNTIFFTIRSSNGDIVVAQQKVPDQTSTMRVDGFSSVSTGIGTLTLGSVNGTATGFVTTDRTLISLRGGTSTTTITLVANSLTKL